MALVNSGSPGSGGCGDDVVSDLNRLGSQNIIAMKLPHNQGLGQMAHSIGFSALLSVIACGPPLKPGVGLPEFTAMQKCAI